MDGLSGLALTREPKAPLDPTVKRVFFADPQHGDLQVTIDNMGYNTVSVPRRPLYSSPQELLRMVWRVCCA